MYLGYWGPWSCKWFSSTWTAVSYTSMLALASLPFKTYRRWQTKKISFLFDIHSYPPYVTQLRVAVENPSNNWRSFIFILALISQGPSQCSKFIGAKCSFGKILEHSLLVDGIPSEFDWFYEVFVAMWILFEFLYGVVTNLMIVYYSQYYCN